MTAIKARPTLYKGIQMRSRLEADYAAALDRDGFSWEYEPDCFAGPDGQWLPDFRAKLPASQADDRPQLVEVKSGHLLKPNAGEGQFGTARRIDEILRRMTVAWLSAPGAVLQLVFWTYGEPAPDLVIASSSNSPWQVQARDILFPLLWPGMGQMDTLSREGESS